MATSVFFNNYNNSQEQRLIEDLIIEMIKIHGLDVYYLPRKSVAEDEILGEDTLSKFDSAYFVEVFPGRVDGFSGQGYFASKFGLEIRDEYTFYIAHRRFTEEVSSVDPNILTRPREGDLIFFDHLRQIFEIKYVTDRALFYELGSLYTYQLVCEKFEYSSERFATGIPAIDAIETKYTHDTLSFSITTESGDMIETEYSELLVNENYDLKDLDSQNAMNDEIQRESDQIIDFSERNPFSESF